MDEQRSYNLNRPAHLVAGQVIRDIEALQMVKYGPQHSAPIHRLVEQYQELLFQRDQKIAELQHQIKAKESQGKRRDNPENRIGKRPGEYGKSWEGDWEWCVPSDGFPTSGPSNNTINEHEDGTITVSSLIVAHGQDGRVWRGYLERGVWRESATGQTDESDGLRLCEDCGDVEVKAPRRLCSSCATQRQIDND